jgi:hypothetical protein
MKMDEWTKRRVVVIASALVQGMVERGEIPLTDEAIKEAMPQAVADARAAVIAAEEYLCG